MYWWTLHKYCQYVLLKTHTQKRTKWFINALFFTHFLNPTWLPILDLELGVVEVRPTDLKF